MRWVFAAVVLAHGLLHLLGFAKAFELAALPALSQPISRAMGLAWLAVAVLLVAAALSIGFASSQRGVAAQATWALALLGALSSQALIVSAWSDARFGTIPNVALLAYGIVGALVLAPIGLRATYRDASERALAAAHPGAPLTETDVAALPAALRRYLSVSGAMGRPIPTSFRARWRGRIRSAEDAPWMALEAEQVNAISPVARYFWLDASLYGAPIIGLHAYADGAASMDVRALGLWRVASASGPEMTRAETVTVFNDACALAPGALVALPIVWQELAADRVAGTLTHAGHTVRAELVFGEDGMLVDFVSDDRGRDVAGRIEPARWSTPLRAPRPFGALTLPSHGEARWHSPGGSFAYVELELLSLEHDPLSPQRGGAVHSAGGASPTSASRNAAITTSSPGS